MTDEWCTIESDPGVFTELIENIGVKGVQVEEIYSLDKDSIEALRPVYGLIFLFKYQFEVKDTRAVCHPPIVYFAKQVINNACATQAILSVLFNASGLDLGSELGNLKQVTGEWPADIKGNAIGNSDQIRKVHNSFARPEPFSFSGSKKAEKDDEVYHFISYVPVDGTLYELDGLKAGPINLGLCTDANWIEKAIESLTVRISTYSNEIRFSLLALVKNRKQIYLDQITELQQKQKALETTAMEVEGQSEVALIKDKVDNLQTLVANEEAKFANWKTENVRRKHNYIPFLFHLLKTLAEKDSLMPLLEQAKVKQKEKEALKEKNKDKTSQ